MLHRAVTAQYGGTAALHYLRYRTFVDTRINNAEAGTAMLENSWLG